MVNKDACIDGASTDARSGGVNKDANSDGTSTDVRIGGASTHIMPMSPSTCDAAVQTFPAPTLCEDSSETLELERVPPTGGKQYATIVPVSLSTRDNAMQTNNIKTSAGNVDVTTTSNGSADVTVQSDSRANHAKTPANGAPRSVYSTDTTNMSSCSADVTKNAV